MNKPLRTVKIQAIIPTLNEEKTIVGVIEGTTLYVDSILVIDGKSEDDTVSLAKEKGAQILIQNGRGKGSALKEAFDYVESEIVVMLDGDGSMRPVEIPLFIEGIFSGADVVKGSRFLVGGGSEDISWLRVLGNTAFVLLVNLIYGTNFTDLCYGYIAFTKNALKKLSPNLRSQGFAIETEILIKAKKLNMKIIEVPSFELNRRFGTSNLHTFRDGFKILSMILTEISLNPISMDK